MMRKYSVLAIAAVASLSLLSASAYAAPSTFPTSENESGPSSFEVHGDTRANVGSGGSGRFAQRHIGGEVPRTFDSRAYEVQTPSSSNESGPSLAEVHGYPAHVGSTRAGSRFGEMLSGGEARDARPYEVQTPSSVNESAPWLSGRASTPIDD